MGNHLILPFVIGYNIQHSSSKFNIAVAVAVAVEVRSTQGKGGIKFKKLF
jgi:hypothetical protein